MDVSGRRRRSRIFAKLTIVHDAKNFSADGVVIRETDKYVVLWKSHHMPAVPAEQNPDALITRFVRRRPDLAAVKGYKPDEFGLLNRLDNDTAGVLLIAKTDESFQSLQEAMKTGGVVKTYLAFCHNAGSETKGVIKLPVAHHIRKRGMMVIADKKPFRGKPQPCSTQFEKITVFQAKQIWRHFLQDAVAFPDLPASEDYAWIKAVITKGKRHQIRLHLSAAGYPIAGDSLYSPHQRCDLPFSVTHHQLYAVGVKFSA